jgi:hypothetical protein
MPSESREMCPCCCGDGKSQLPQWQHEVIETRRLKTGEVYGALFFECQTSGQKWQTEHQNAMTLLAKNQTIEQALMERLEAQELTEAALEIDKQFERPWLGLV